MPSRSGRRRSDSTTSNTHSPIRLTACSALTTLSASYPFLDNHVRSMRAKATSSSTISTFVIGFLFVMFFACKDSNNRIKKRPVRKQAFSKTIRFHHATVGLSPAVGNVDFSFMGRTSRHFVRPGP